MTTETDTPPSPQTISWYRTPLGPGEMKRLCVKSNWLGGLQTFGHLGILALTGGLALYSFFHWSVVVTGMLVFLHGTVAAFSANAVHELTHNTVFRTKLLNWFFARVFAFICWGYPEYFQVSHARHHRYTLHQPDDLEVVLPIRLMARHFFLHGFLDPAGFWQTLKINFRLARGRFVGDWEKTLFPESQPEKRRPVIRFARILWGGHLLIAVVSLASGLWFLPVLTSLTPLYGQWLFWLCNNTQHIGLQDEVPDFRLCSRTFLLNPVLQFLYWHMNFHIEHHMYAAVPCYRLGRLHRLIAHDLPTCTRGLWATWREIWEIEMKQEKDPQYQHVAILPKAEG